VQAVHTRRVGRNDVSDIVECNEQRDVFLLEEHARFVVIDRQVRREVDHVRPSRRHDRSLAALYESLDHQLVRAVPYGYRYLDITSSYTAMVATRRIAAVSPVIQINSSYFIGIVIIIILY